MPPARRFAVATFTFLAACAHTLDPKQPLLEQINPDVLGLTIQGVRYNVVKEISRTPDMLFLRLQEDATGKEVFARCNPQRGNPGVFHLPDCMITPAYQEPGIIETPPPSATTNQDPTEAALARLEAEQTDMENTLLSAYDQDVIAAIKRELAHQTKDMLWVPAAMGLTDRIENTEVRLFWKIVVGTVGTYAESPAVAEEFWAKSMCQPTLPSGETPNAATKKIATRALAYAQVRYYTIFRVPCDLKPPPHGRPTLQPPVLGASPAALASAAPGRPRMYVYEIRKYTCDDRGV